MAKVVRGYPWKVSRATVYRVLAEDADEYLAAAVRVEDRAQGDECIASRSVIHIHSTTF